VRRLPDTELIPLVRSGSGEAAEVLFDRYWASAWKAAYAVTAERALADDAAQEAMARAFGSLDRFDETRPFGPWLKRIAVNRAIDHLRRRRRVEPLPEGQLPLEPWAGGEDADAELRLWAVTDAVAALSLQRRIVVVLHYWLDLPLEEIAGVLGLPVGTVASRLARARSELRRVLEEAGHVV
jgi:RNA polymerase sigma-70 factor (ECF subfamily)